MLTHRLLRVLFLVASLMLLLWRFTALEAQDNPPATSEVSLSEEAVMEWVEQFNAIFDGPNLDIVDEIFAEDFVGHLPLAPELDREGWKAYVASFYEAFPDMTEEVHDVVIGDDTIAIRVSYTGTHDGPLFGIPATGNTVTMTGTGIFRFNEEGLAVENWADLDVVGVLAQIGAFPPEQPAP